MKKFWRLRFGRITEQKAMQYLKKHGYETLEKNWRVKMGEIDLIVQKEDCIVFVEVKALVYSQFFSPEDHYDYDKHKKQVLLGRVYLSGLADDTNARFDLITVVKKGGDYFIEHYENVIDEYA